MCAHVAENVWICHPGTLDEDGTICANPFDVEDLVVRDIVTEQFKPDAQRRVRIRPRPKANLLAVAASSPSSFSVARAFALWKAEEARAETGRFDTERACAGFERDPFKWTAEGWASQIQIGLLWRWLAQKERQELVFVRADNLFNAERSIPRPVDLKLPCENWWSACEDAANKQRLCKYLGVQVSEGVYEPDPRKWRGEEKSKLSV